MIITPLRIVLVVVLATVNLIGIKAQSLDFNFPDPGENRIYETIELAVPLDLNSTGAGLVWNLSPSHIWYSDTVAFDDPVTSSFQSYFPTADLYYASSPGPWLNEDGFVYLNRSANQINIVGYVFTQEDNPGVLIPVPAINHIKFIDLPVQLGNSFSDTGLLVGYVNGNLVGAPYDSVMIRSYRFAYDTIDARGTLVLTDRSYPDVLRKKSVATYLDSLFYYDEGNSEWVFGTIIEDQTMVDYKWLGDSTDFILASVSVWNDTVGLYQVVPQEFIPPPFGELQFANVPDTVTAGITYAGFQVNAILQPDNVAFTTYSGTVFLGVQSQTVQLQGNPMAQAVNGTATFTNVSFSGSGHAVLHAGSDTLFSTTQTVFVTEAPPPTVYLEILNLPDTMVENDQVTIQIAAKRVADGSIVVSYNDTVRLQIVFGSGFGFTGVNAAAAVSGIAEFNGSFFGQGAGQIFAYSDTTLADTNQLVVLPRAQQLVFLPQLGGYDQNVIGPAITVNALDGADSLAVMFEDTVRIGKISGPGNLNGTLKKRATDGIAIFDDLSFSFPGEYKLLTFPNTSFYNPVIEDDTITLTVLPEPWSQYSFSHVDTLSEFFERSGYWYYEVNADGYLSGTSREWYSEIAQRFDFTGQARLTKVLLYFADRDVIGSDDDIFAVKVYNEGVQNSPFLTHTDSLPKEFLGEQAFAANDIITTDFLYKVPTVVVFDQPIDIFSDFHLALEVNRETANDTIILWTNLPGEALGERRTSRFADNYPGNPAHWVLDHYFRPSFDVDLMIVPVLEVDTIAFITEVGNPSDETHRPRVYPNPFRDVVEIEWQDTSRPTSISIFSIEGKLLLTALEPSNSVIRLNLSILEEGTYLVQVDDPTGHNRSNLKIVKLD